MRIETYNCRGALHHYGRRSLFHKEVGGKHHCVGYEGYHETPDRLYVRTN